MRGSSHVVGAFQRNDAALEVRMENPFRNGSLFLFYSNSLPGEVQVC